MTCILPMANYCITIVLLHLYRAIQVYGCIPRGCVLKSTSGQCCSTGNYFNYLYCYRPSRSSTTRPPQKCHYGDEGTHCTVVKVQKNITVQHMYKTGVNMLMLFVHRTKDNIIFCVINTATYSIYTTK